MDLSKHLEKAEEAVKRRNYAFAVNLYGQLLALQPDNGDARAGLRRALFKKAEQKPPSKVFAMIGGGVPLLIAKISGLCRAHGSSVKGFERYLALDPLSEGTNLALAAACDRAGWTKSALAVYHAWAGQQPRCLEASREAGRLLYEDGQLDEALAMYEQALKVDPRDQESLRARKNLAAEGALKATGLEGATSSRDLIKDKAAHQKQERSARLHLSPEEIEAELDENERRLGDHPDDVKALARLAELHRMRRDPQSALDCLERLIQLRPDDSDVRNRAGDLRLQVQEQQVESAAERGDESAAAMARKALIEARVGEFRRRVDQNPTDLALRFDLGAALFDAGAHDEAISELQQAVKDPRRQADALFLLGRAFAAKGHGDIAQTQLEKALDAAGGVGGELGKDILYELGSVAETLGAVDSALEHYSRILEQDYGFRDAASRVERLKSNA